jgi:hypothetical protein
VDVEAEMQGLLDAVTDPALADHAQVRILEVASLPEITKALRQDQYHVLHLFGHGSADGIELEDEDGNAASTPTNTLVDAATRGQARAALGRAGIVFRRSWRHHRPGRRARRPWGGSGGRNAHHRHRHLRHQWRWPSLHVNRGSGSSGAVHREHGRRLRV